MPDTRSVRARMGFNLLRTLFSWSLGGGLMVFGAVQFYGIWLPKHAVLAGCATAAIAIIGIAPPDVRKLKCPHCGLPVGSE
jgi:hypothetical protein